MNLLKNNNLTIPILGWGLLIIQTSKLGYQIKSSLKDLSVINVESIYIKIIMILFCFILFSIPIILPIAILLRKNWGRIGQMLLSIFYVGSSIYIFSIAKALPAHFLLFVLFYLIVFFVLNSSKVRNEFTK